MIDHIENLLEAWGKVRRGDARLLKRPVFAQSSYGEVRGASSVGDGEGVEVLDRTGRRHVFSIRDIERVAWIVGRLPEPLKDVVESRYLLVASQKYRAANVGLSESTFKRRLMDAKVAFGIAWYADTRGVKQRGVMLNHSDYQNKHANSV